MLDIGFIYMIWASVFLVLIFENNNLNGVGNFDTFIYTKLNPNIGLNNNFCLVFLTRYKPMLSCYMYFFNSKLVLEWRISPFIHAKYEYKFLEKMITPASPPWSNFPKNNFSKNNFLNVWEESIRFTSCQNQTFLYC